MTVNILVGIGGTGAKVAEAIVHATVIGLGADKLSVGFIDQDRANGNTSRARALVETVVKARSLWRTNGNAHRLDSGELLRPDVSFIDQNQIWTPHPEPSTTLARIFGSIPDDKPYFDLLFEEGATEQDMPLDGGYRGRPYIGSAAITAAIQNEADPFWRALDGLLQHARTGEQVRLLLAGSVFGGTGAAGFPTIARLIKRKIEAAGVVHNVTVGGVLMLPYFAFPPAEAGAEGRAANVAKSDELLMQSRGALRYYNELLRDEQVFNDLFLVGWNRPFQLRHHAPDTAEQLNPALLPELIAAMGACRYFTEKVPHAPTDGTRVFISARANDNQFGWDDLPSPDSRDTGAPFDKFGQALRYAVAWKHYRPFLARKPSFFTKVFARQAWYSKQLVNKVDYNLAAPDDELVAMDGYVNALLSWAGSIQAFASQAGLSFNLWKLDGAIKFETDSRNGTVNVIQEITDDGAIAKAYDEAIVVPEATPALPSTSALINDLTTSVQVGSHQGLGQMVASLHKFSAVVSMAKA